MFLVCSIFFFFFDSPFFCSTDLDSLRSSKESPPRSSAFEANVVTNFPVLLVFCQLIVENTVLEDEKKLALFVPLVELLKMHEYLIKFVSFCANGEAKKCSDPNTLFRESSVLVMLFRALGTHRAGHVYLKRVVKEIAALLDGAGPLPLLEGDVSSLSQEQLAQSVATLSKTINAVFDCASKSLDDCPPVIRIFFQTVYQIVNVRHSGMPFASLVGFPPSRQ